MTSVEPGRYGVVRTRGFLGWVIRRATKSPYDHAFLFAGVGNLIEATPYDVRLAPVTGYTGALMAASTAEPMTAEQRAAVVAKALSYLGTEYGWDDLAVIALSELGLHWRLLIRAMGAQRALICSQLVAICGQAAGMDWQCGKESPALVTPADLARRAGVRPVSV